MKNTQIKIKSFIIDEGKETEKKYECNDAGLPRLDRKKKRKLIDIQDMYNKIDGPIDQQDSTLDVSPFQEFNFSPIQEICIHEPFDEITLKYQNNI
ncbi:hypothetical protein TVAG_295710 [Trichomonas vaginalis G3]|uniref:Uncharacterized protein n=1 Tax=Trichomonas vaginalis (strain ATCC PRA-98 / G3) TaxID=412133 RepID=A2F238_TRIV3|nr:hypothetical protein TVAGG3_0971650 [Trichomonas vaginalis G3]EAY01037.1 hypothetical protein TVAG_295710 [Trichomonas vaginalis G3]KAI5488632.1 hypothetical protein TVAGG3_0971650 [Trichomonas vaginalis G3]|eukprot:XP_001330075.1 hypothetical protein [Trichomonas vaginalis G3]